MERKKNSTPDFGTFWEAYGEAYGEKLDRLRAERAWNRLPARDRRAAYAGIATYRERCLRSGISMMYAQGYLNNRRWEDGAAPTPAPAREEKEAEMLEW